MLYLRLLTIAVIGFTVSTSQTLLKSGHECRTDDIRLNLETPSTLRKCNEACLAKPDCTYFIYGTAGYKKGWCYHELTGSYHDHELTNDLGCEKGFEVLAHNHFHACSICVHAEPNTYPHRRTRTIFTKSVAAKYAVKKWDVNS